VLFSSFIFISAFLPLTIAVYYCVPRVARTYVLLAASIVFYAWGDFRYLSIMFGVIALNYLGALVVEALPRHLSLARKAFVASFILGNIGVLVYFKYFDFIMVNLSWLTDMDYALRNIVMPLGISFYTFQGLSYLVDVYRGEIVAQRNLLNLSLFISFFPQLVAGPILKYHDVCEEIACRRETVEHFVYGLQRFVMGLGRKVLVANSMGFIADRIFSQEIGTFDAVTAWGGAVAYSLQLYFDFSGYSDMAIGLGAMFGFHFKENFEYPYVSTSISEFWRRWHISLSTWFKEYLYIPLGGNRVSKLRNILNLALVFLATGIWHGAAWNFILWGMIHGLLVIAEKVTGFSKVGDRLLSKVVHHCYLLFFVICAWVLFRAEDLTHAVGYLRSMFGLVECHPIYEIGYYFSHFSILMMLVAAVLAFGAARGILIRQNHSLLGRCAFNVWLVCVFVLSQVFLAGATYNPFIYFRF